MMLGKQVLEGSLGITCDEPLTDYEDFLHLLTIDFDGTVIAHQHPGRRFTSSSTTEPSGVR